MAKVITFSRGFPAYHSCSGKPTFFVEKFLNSMGENFKSEIYFEKLMVLNTVNIMSEKLSYSDVRSFYDSLNGNCCLGKSHTIRGGSRFKSGDLFSPRCWFGKPYNSPQIIFWDDTVIHIVPAINIAPSFVNGKKTQIAAIFINGKLHFDWHTLALNDGLTQQEMCDWFLPSVPMVGQIIVWGNDINY